MIYDYFIDLLKCFPANNNSLINQELLIINNLMIGVSIFLSVLTAA